MEASRWDQNGRKETLQQNPSFWPKSMILPGYRLGKMSKNCKKTHPTFFYSGLLHWSGAPHTTTRCTSGAHFGLVAAVSSQLEHHGYRGCCTWICTDLMALLVGVSLSWMHTGPTGSPMGPVCFYRHEPNASNASKWAAFGPVLEPPRDGC